MPNQNPADAGSDADDLYALATRMAIESLQRDALVLDRIRDSIGRDDVEAWNALTSTACHLRVEASLRETEIR